jgi:peroxiredoxin
MTENINFSLKELKSNETVSLSDFYSKPVILQFWVSWCPDCMRELPLLEQFYASMKNDEIVVLTINVTGREGSTEQRDTFIKKNNLTVPVLEDNGTEVYDRYHCSSVPTTVLLDAEHQIRKVYTDKDTFKDILYGVSGLLT